MTRRMNPIVAGMAVSMLAFLAIAALAGCSSRRMHHGSLDSWVGVPVEAYIRANGQPSGRRMLPNGYAAYTFERSWIAFKPTENGESHGERSYGPTRGVETAVYKDTSLNMSCTTWLETDKEGIIIRWKQQGNGCY